MKVVTPEISWHERDPIYSVDFQPGSWPIQRLASGGVDKIVRIWQMTVDAEGKGDFEFLSNLRRHTATVNVVRFSKDGNILATAGDDQAIILWKLSDVPTPANNIFAEDDVEEDKETWVCYKTLRGHLGDVADLSWSKDSRQLVSGSVDNSAILWDVSKGTKLAIFSEHKSYVQGVAFDPLGNFIATLSADRSLRVYNLSSKSCVHNVSKLSLPAAATEEGATPGSQPEAKPKAFRIFHDDGLRSFFRRLEFSPDGQLLVTPAGCMEVADKTVNASFVFSRAAFSKPAVYLPSGNKCSTVVRTNPQLFQLRPVEATGESEKEGQLEWEKNKSMFCLPYRMVFAVATEESVILYDSQQTMPLGLLKNIHYHQLSDLAWSSDGRALIVSSTDGFCTVATFEENELGVPYRGKDTGDNPGSVSKTDQPSEPGLVDVELKTPPKPRPQSSPAGSSEKAAQGLKIGKEASPCGSSAQNNESEVKQTPPQRKPKSPGLQENVKNKSNKETVANKLEDLNIKESTSATIQSARTEIEKKSSPPSSSSKSEETTLEKEEPKRKRIQFTTLSLNSK